MYSSMSSLRPRFFLGAMLDNRSTVSKKNFSSKIQFIFKLEFVKRVSSIRWQ